MFKLLPDFVLVFGMALSPVQAADGPKPSTAPRGAAGLENTSDAPVADTLGLRAIGDWNGDGFVDIADYAALPACLTGPTGNLGAGCSAFDFDGDGHVSLADVADFELVFDPDRPPAGCVWSSPTWLNQAMDPQTGVFVAEYNATPSGTAVDALNTLSDGPCGTFADAAVAVRFNSTGTIDVRNGSTYAADTVIAYQANQTYHVRLVASLLTHTYSVFVTPPSGPAQLLAADYAFRTEQSAVTVLDHWGLWAVAAHEVCDFQTGAPPATLCLSPTALNFGSSLTGLTFELWNCGSGTLGYSVTDNAAWLSVTPPSGSSTGEHDTLTATVSRTGLPNGNYQGAITVTPSVGAAISIPVSLTVGTVPATNLTPVARWDVVPRQRIDPGATLKCGVVAFSKYGIQKVRFAVNAGTPVDVSAMTLNDQSQVYEYWFPIVASTFTTDGPITVTATVYGNDGGTRTLPPLTFIVNGHGTLPRPQAWVAASGGSDSTGMVNDPSKPFATIGKALDHVRAWMSAGGYGNKADGGIVRLRPGSHTLQNAGFWSGVTTTQEWVTLTCDPGSGGNRTNTLINQVTAAGDYLSSEWLKVEGLTLDLPVNNRPFFETSSSAVKAIWIHDCTVIGSDRYDFNPHPVGQNYWYKYFTNSSLTNLRFAQGEGFSAQLARNLTITHIGEDAFADSPVIINVDLSDQDPGPPGGHEWHADAWQSPGITTSAPAPENYIIYNYRGTDLHYQAIFGRVKALSSNNAFVNVFMEMRTPVRDYGAGNEGVGSWLGGTYDHLLMWNCTFIGTGTGHDFWWANESYTGSPQFRITNASFRGNVFTRWLTTEDLSWTQASTVEFVDNHYVTPTGSLTYTPGAPGSYSTGAPGLVTDTASPDFGSPLPTSPLANRIGAPVVPADIDGIPRTSGCDIGAFEH